MAIFRGLSKYISFRRDLYNSIKLDANGKFYLDNKFLQRSLEVEGISGYANTTIPILKQAVEEITNRFGAKDVPKYSKAEETTNGVGAKDVPKYSKSALLAAALWYMLGAFTFYSSIDRLRHSRFLRDA